MNMSDIHQLLAIIRAASGATGVLERDLEDARKNRGNPLPPSLAAACDEVEQFIALEEAGRMPGVREQYRLKVCKDTDRRGHIRAARKTKRWPGNERRGVRERRKEPRTAAAPDRRAAERRENAGRRPGDKKKDTGTGWTAGAT